MTFHNPELVDLVPDGEYRSNPDVALQWTQANLVLALQAMRETSRA